MIFIHYGWNFVINKVIDSKVIENRVWNIINPLLKFWHICKLSKTVLKISFWSIVFYLNWKYITQFSNKCTLLKLTIILNITSSITLILRNNSRQYTDIKLLLRLFRNNTTSLIPESCIILSHSGVFLFFYNLFLPGVWRVLLLFYIFFLWINIANKNYQHYGKYKKIEDHSSFTF